MRKIILYVFRKGLQSVGVRNGCLNLLSLETLRTRLSDAIKENLKNCIERKKKKTN